MKKIFLATISALALTGAAYAGDRGHNFGDTASGSMSGHVSSFAASGGASFGDGSTQNAAGQFSASEGVMQFDPRYGQGDSRDGMTVTMTSESYTSGFSESETAGNGWGGAIQFGTANAGGSWGLKGSDDW